MFISKLVRNMQAAGAPLEAITVAIEAIESDRKTLDEIRRKARERKQKQRDLSRDMNVTRT